ncbi:MAG: SDR family NAD(P)-dependent oxidoreductase, partial [Pseudomonadota bacterium]
MTGPAPRLFVFGLGYSATALARRALREGWQVGGTVRDAQKADRLRGEGIAAVTFDGAHPSRAAAEGVSGATHVLSSIAPPRGQEGALDPVLACHAPDLARAPSLRWLGYLSTIGVYGDHGGAWIDETAPPDHSSARARTRVAAEAGWQALGRSRRIPAQVFRLGGIYGPGRSQLDALREGRARRLVKPGQVFNRIHVADIAGLVLAGMAAERTL